MCIGHSKHLNYVRPVFIWYFSSQKFKASASISSILKIPSEGKYLQTKWSGGWGQLFIQFNPKPCPWEYVEDPKALAFPCPLPPDQTSWKERHFWAKVSKTWKSDSHLQGPQLQPHLSPAPATRVTCYQMFFTAQGHILKLSLKPVSAFLTWNMPYFPLPPNHPFPQSLSSHLQFLPETPNGEGHMMPSWWGGTQDSILLWANTLGWLIDYRSM